MKHLTRLRPSQAMVVACLALGIALGGTSYAAIKVPRNSVGTKQLMKNAVTGPKVKNNALTGADVLESSLAKVPSAAAADTATNATNATNAANLGGVGAASYLKNSGLILVNAAFGDWQVGGSSPADFTPQYFSNVTNLQSGSAHPSEFGNVSADIPSSLYGKSLSLVGTEVCYSATSASVQLDAVFLNVYTNSTGPAGPTAATFTDDTNRDDSTCRVYNLATPFTLTGDNVVNLVVRLIYTAAGSFQAGRTTFILQPTGTNSSPPTALDATTLTRVPSASIGKSAGLAP